MKRIFNIPYKFEITLIMEKEGQPDEEQRLFFRKGKSETFFHLLLKLIAYCYFWDKNKRLIIEPNFKFRKYKPDLISFSPSEIPRRMTQEIDLWIECKKLSIKKLIKLSHNLPHSKIYWFHTQKAFQKILSNIKIKLKLKALKNLKLIGVTSKYNPFKSLAIELGKKNQAWQLQRIEDQLVLTNGFWKEVILFSSINL
jgi:hypothetical protein